MVDGHRDLHWDCADGLLVVLISHSHHDLGGPCDSRFRDRQVPVPPLPATKSVALMVCGLAGSFAGESSLEKQVTWRSAVMK